jgi:formate dehydrogenase (coenzyme F420) beta subunit
VKSAGLFRFLLLTHPDPEKGWWLMNEFWVLETQGDVLGTARAFLDRLWEAADLDGMVLPVYRDSAPYAAPQLVTRRDWLSQADPFVPILSFNTAGYMSELAQNHPGMHYGVILRACEGRAFRELVKRDSLHPDDWLTIGVDCLSTYPQDDLDWRLGKTGSLEMLTHESLRFARQGGIALYRYRKACQMCDPLAPRHTDVTLGVLGLPVDEVMLVGVQDDQLARDLNFDALVHGRASRQMQSLREKTLQSIKERRDRTYDRILADLPDHLPLRMGELIAWLEACEPCKRCLEACPVYNGVLEVNGNGGSVAAEELVAWLGACSACGMCEQACPANRPLTSVHIRLKRELVGKIAALNL